MSRLEAMSGRGGRGMPIERTVARFRSKSMEGRGQRSTILKARKGPAIKGGTQNEGRLFRLAFVAEG